MFNKFTTEEYIKKAKQMHGEIYDYSKIIYINCRKKVKIGYKEFFVESDPIKFLDEKYQHNSMLFKTDVFIKKSIEIHGNKYDYSKVEYINNITPVLIGFNGIYHAITPANHLKGSSIEKRKTFNTLDSFVEKANIIHNNKYVYDESIFNKLDDKVTIKCKVHSYFDQVASYHLLGHGCPKCGKESMASKSRMNFEKIVEKIKNKHNNKFTYKNLNEDVKLSTILYIICPKHGEFKQKTVYHLEYGCRHCGYEKSANKHTKDIFVQNANKKWNNYYNYDKFEYTISSDKSIITCPKHGDFLQSPNHHLKSGCKTCGYLIMTQKTRYSQSDFFEKCNIKHNNFYDYSQSLYINSRTNIDIPCPKHGTFSQNSCFHLAGGGCPNCSESRGEKLIRIFMEKSNINFVQQKKFKECKSILSLPFDFYLPDHNICIEFDGIQHYKAVQKFGGDESLHKTKINDKIKNNFCRDNNIKLVRIPYWDIKNVEDILKNELNIND